MGVRASVKEMVETFGETYRAIDIRTAAIREGEAWVNALTVVRVTYEEPEVAAERLRRLEQMHGKVEAKRFRVVMCARPFSELKDFCGEVARGVLPVGSVEIKLRQALALEDQRNQLDAFSGDIRPFDGADWPNLRLHIGPHQRTELIDEVLARQVSALGYPDAYEAINVLCEVNVRLGQSYGYDLYLSLPVFIRVLDARLAPPEKRLYIVVKRHNKLGDIKGIVLLRGRRTVAGQPYKARSMINSFSRSEEGSPIETASGSAELAEIEAADWVDVRLMHSEFGEVDGYFSREVGSLIPVAERNVLFEALRRFCPDAELDGLLVRPHEVEPQKLNQSAAFELHVAWVLGLFGLSTVVLGKYEHIVAPGTRVQRASVDILAAGQKSKTLLVVACTLGTPKEEDFGNLANVREILAREVFAETTVRILPVVFTAASGCPSYKEVDGIFNFIPIIDADGLDALLALLRAGQERRFFEFLNDPGTLSSPEVTGDVRWDVLGAW